MAMSMPIIPGLAGAPSPEDDEAPPGVAGLLDALSDEEFAQLEQAAEEMAGAVPADGSEPGGDMHDESTETPEEEMAESDEQQQEEQDEGEEDVIPHRRAAEDAARMAQKQLAELSAMVDQAADHEDAGIDVKELEDCLSDAEDAAKEAQEACDEACDEEDAEKAAELAQDAQEAQARVAAALEDAKGKIASDAQEANKNAVPQEVLDMTAWAKKVAGIA